MQLPKLYVDKIKRRNKFSFIKGAIARLPKYMTAAFVRNWARVKGAKIGEGTVLSWKLAKSANSNLVVGDDCAIDADYLDLRGKVIIGDHVIINKGVQIIRLSHYINNDTVFTTRYYLPLEIEDYAWIATNSLILPHVTKIEKGCVCGAGSVICKNTESMGVYSGNPATKISCHNTLYTDALVIAFRGCDFPYYIKAWFSKNPKNELLFYQ